MLFLLVACDETIIAADGTLNSPGFPEPVRDARSCTYQFMGETNKQYLVRFTNFTVPCEFGYLEIRYE